MGIIPLQYLPGQNAESLGLDGREDYSIDIPSDLKTGQTMEVKVKKMLNYLKVWYFIISKFNIRAQSIWRCGCDIRCTQDWTLQIYFTQY